MLGERVRAVGVARGLGQRENQGYLVLVEMVGADDREGRGHAVTVTAIRRFGSVSSPEARRPAPARAAPGRTARRTCIRPGAPSRSSTRTPSRAWRAAAA